MKYFRSFVMENSGSLAILFVSVLTGLVIAAGVALDYARALSDRTEGQAIADSMVLAAAKELQLGADKPTATKTALKIYRAHYGEAAPAPDIAIDNAGAASGFNLRVSFTQATDTTFMRLKRREPVSWTVEAYSEVMRRRAEIAFVADVSASMAGEKMVELRTALTQLVQAIFPNDIADPGMRISLIPYSDTIHFGESYRDWLDPDSSKAAAHDFIGCFRPDRFTDRMRVVPKDVVPGHYKAFKQSHLNGYPFCMSENSRVVLFESDPAALVERINRMEIGFGTGTDIALGWGWRALSPEWRGKFKASGQYPLDHSSDSRKILVLFTDGEAVRYDMDGDGKGNDRKPVSDRMYATVQFFRQTCKAIQRTGKIDLYAVAYDLNKEENTITRMARQNLKECIAGNGKFLEASYGNLKAAFEELIGEINIIRLKR